MDKLAYIFGYVQVEIEKRDGLSADENTIQAFEARIINAIGAYLKAKEDNNSTEVCNQLVTGFYTLTEFTLHSGFKYAYDLWNDLDKTTSSDYLDVLFEKEKTDGPVEVILKDFVYDLCSVVRNAPRKFDGWIEDLRMLWLDYVAICALEMTPDQLYNWIALKEEEV